MALNINQADDDLNNLAKTFLNQKQNVVAAGTGVATTISSTGKATGTVASPGQSGFGGSAKPGKRLYNPLSKLASYTYNISLYMITPNAYSAFIESGRQRIDALSTSGGPNGSIGEGAYLIAQSGGINNKTSRRAPGFELDYYIDNLRFFTETATKTTTQSSVSAVSEFDFTITEPYGFSFVSNLRKAAAALIINQSNTTGYEQSNLYKQFFILGIRFYGYDIDGNLVKPQDALYGEPIDPLGTNSLFENFYDIQLNDIKFRLDGKTVQYAIKAASVSGQTMLGVKRGRIPTGATVDGSTVDDALQGENGLFTKLNKAQEDLAKKDPPSLSIPNKYNVVYLGDAYNRLGLASLVTKADLQKSNWGGTGAKSSTESTDAKGSIPPDNNSRLITINNDTSIVQAIEQIVKRSAFTVNALNVTYSNTTEPDPKQKNNPQAKRENPNRLTWYNVSTEIVKAEWDDKVKDWAYETNYLIQLYEIPSVETPYAEDTSKYYGCHKKYDYWFTGKNSEILDLQLTYNGLYYNAVLGLELPPSGNSTQAQNPGGERENEQQTSGGGSGSSTGNTGTTSGNTGLKADPPPASAGDDSAGSAGVGGMVAITPGLNSGGDKTGALGIAMSAQNSVTTYLNDPDAYANATMKIMGDPDYLVRDAATSVSSLYDKFYGPDGYTISAQGGQVFIEVAFKEAVDYNDNTGTLMINEDLFFINYPPYIKEMTNGAIIWGVSNVQSTFSSGRFEQTLNLYAPSFAGIGPTSGPIVTEDPTFNEPSGQQSISTSTGSTTNDDADTQPTGNSPDEGGRD